MANILKTLAAGSEAGAYEIQRSLRFNSADSAYLSRTPASAGNRKTWTYSFWVKRAGLGTFQTLLMSGTDSENSTQLRFNSADTIKFEHSDASVETGTLVTTQVFRDVSAWYHIVFACDTTQATSSNRLKLYVNGAQVTAFSSSTYPSQNADLDINITSAHTIGGSILSTNYLSGYMTDVYLVDGQALTPSSFGETNPDTGVWQPIPYAGTYGTNGFYLNFSDNSNTTASTLGKDYSGNGNNWTPNNFSVTAGAGNDSLVDSPTPYGTDTGAGGEVRGNYATLNPLRIGSNLTLSNGNLNITTGATGGKIASSTVGLTSGKWYWEATLTASGELLIGVEDGSANLGQYLGGNANGWGYDSINGSIFYNSTGSAYGSTFTTNDVIGVAVDMDAKKIWFSKNGTFQNSGSPTGGTNAAFTNLSSIVFPVVSPYDDGSGCAVNFGQRPFAYTAPSGFKALVTTNLPTPAIGATASTRSDDYFNTVLYTGNGSTQSITGVGFQPDFVWAKSRSNGVRNHRLYDVIRGTTKELYSSTTDQETTDANGLTAFGTDGFTVGSSVGVNENTATMVAWNWKANGSGSTNTAGSITSTVSANTTSGFSIVTYTGTGSNATVGHGLGVAPRMMIVKSRSGSDSWIVYHASLGNTQFAVLNNTDAAQTASTLWNNTSPTSTVFTVGTSGGVNTSSGTYVAYCFAEVEGFSKFGSYTGNGSADGPFAYLGFRPAFVMLKRTDSTSNWTILDFARIGYNVDNNPLFPNLSDAETTTDLADLLSNGFKLRSTDASVNASGGTYVFAAFSSNPFKFALAR